MESFITVGDGVRLFVQIVGSGEPVLIPMAYRCGEFEVVARNRQVILYDPRGRGRSNALDASELTFEHDLADLERVRAELGLRTVSLIGWSYLGGLVARYAMDHPDRVTNVVLVGSTGVRCDVQAVHEEQTRRLHAAAPHLMKRLKEGVPVPPAEARALTFAMVRTRCGRTPPWPGKRHEYLLDAFAAGSENRPSNFRILRDLVQTMGDWDWRQDARRIVARVLVVYGVADLLPNHMCADWIEAVPDSRGLMLQGVGHFPSLEDPDLFFAAVEEFLDGQWPAASFSSQPAAAAFAGRPEELGQM